MNALSQNTKITVSDINTLISECNGKLNLSGGTLSNKITFTSQRVIDSNNINGMFIVSDSTVDSSLTSSLGLFPISHTNTNRNGGFELTVSDGTNTKRLSGHYTNGLSWDGNFNVTHTSSPNITVNNTSGGESSIIIDRGTRSGWKFQNPNGNLIIQNNWTDARGDWFNVLTINYNTGNATFKGTVKAEQYLFNNGSKLWIA